MSNVAIVTDSTAYIPAHMQDGLPVTTIPLHVLWQDQDYRDGIDLSPQAFYQALPKEPEMPKTSQITTQEFVEVYRRLLDQGYEILSIHISGKLSGTVSAALQAARQIGHSGIEVVDSMSGSMAMGWQVLESAKAAVAGAALQECRAIAERARARTNIFFVPGTLEYLHKGGRINWAENFFGSLLQIRPVIETQEGLMLPVDKVRTLSRAMSRALDLAEQRIGSAVPIRLAALYADIPELANQMLELARQRLGADRVVEAFTTTISPVLGTHIGPGAVGLAYMAGEPRLI